MILITMFFQNKFQATVIKRVNKGDEIRAFESIFGDDNEFECSTEQDDHFERILDEGDSDYESCDEKESSIHGDYSRYDVGMDVDYGCREVFRNKIILLKSSEGIENKMLGVVGLKFGKISSLRNKIGPEVHAAPHLHLRQAAAGPF